MDVIREKGSSVLLRLVYECWTVMHHEYMYSLDASKKCVQNNTNRQQKASRCSWHASQRSHDRRTSSQQHSRDPAIKSRAVSNCRLFTPELRTTATYRIFVHNPKTINVRCAYAPYRALITSRKVCALGALRFSSIASVANSRICTVAPEAYQKGPETPYLYATPDDCNNVAAHVHDDTTADATNPVFTVRPAVLNISDVCTSFWYLRYQESN